MPGHGPAGSPVIRALLDEYDPARPVMIAGCTASGKSSVALEIAEAQGRAVVNADALQVFGGWRILTARPDAAVCARAPHLLYGHVDRAASYSVGDWTRDVTPLLQARPAPVIVGGTGLYFQALLVGLADIPATDPEMRVRATRHLAEAGLDAMVAELDAPTRAQIDVQNPMRVQRAWEVWQQTGRGLAAWQEDTGPPLVAPDAAHRIVVTRDRARLNRHIEHRLKEMLAQGLMDEVRTMAPFWDPTHQSARAIGAAAFMAAHRREVPISAALAATVTATQQYAKRQRTWIRSKMADWTEISP